MATDIAERPGIWLRSGQVGVIVGLNWPAALAAIPTRADRDRVERLLKEYELGLLSGSSKAAKASADAEKRRRESEG